MGDTKDRLEYDLRSTGRNDELDPLWVFPPPFSWRGQPACL